MQPLIKRFVRGESDVTAYGLIAAALMLIGVGAWVVATAPRVVASPQIGIDPLQMMMGKAGNLPTSYYDDVISSGGHEASLVELPKKEQRRVKKSH